MRYSDTNTQLERVYDACTHMMRFYSMYARVVVGDYKTRRVHIPSKEHIYKTSK